MKLFISADIEGCVGTTLSDEVRQGQSAYAPFARQMTAEVLAVCETALQCGATEIVVKDGHGTATNIDPLAMPKGVTLIRGKSGHPSNMMFGLDSSFDAVMYIGYHAQAGSPENPLSHTSTGNTNYVLLNGEPMSEFLLNSYTAASHGVPVIFLSGDQGICNLAKAMVPSMETVATKVGVGASNICKPPQQVLEELKEATKVAVSSDFSKGTIALPPTFEYVANYKDLKKAYQMSFYPKMESVDPRTNKMKTDTWMDVITAHSFVVY